MSLRAAAPAAYNDAMKSIIVPVIVLVGVACFASNCLAQANAGAAGEEGTTAVSVSRPPPATRVESLLLKKGIVLVRGYTEVATLQAEDGAAIRITAIELIDTTHRAREYGLAIEVWRGERHVVSYIDHDEIDDINAALSSINRLDASATHLANYEATYRSRGGVDLTSYSDNGSRFASLRTTQYLDPSNQQLVATATFRLTVLPDLQRNLNEAKQILDKAKAASE